MPFCEYKKSNNLGTDWNNQITDGTTVNMDWDYDAIKATHRTASLVRDPKGQKMDVHYDTFIFSRGSSPSFRAQEILGAIKRGLMPGSADNDSSINNYSGSSAAFNIIDLPYISTNTAYWFGLDSTMKGDDYGLQYKESEGITLYDANYVYKTGKHFALCLRKFANVIFQSRLNSYVPSFA